MEKISQIKIFQKHLNFLRNLKNSMGHYPHCIQSYDQLVVESGAEFQDNEMLRLAYETGWNAYSFKLEFKISDFLTPYCEKNGINDLKFPLPKEKVAETRKQLAKQLLDIIDEKYIIKHSNIGAHITHRPTVIKKIKSILWVQWLIWKFLRLN